MSKINAAAAARPKQETAASEVKPQPHGNSPTANRDQHVGVAAATNIFGEAASS